MTVAAKAASDAATTAAAFTEPPATVTGQRSGYDIFSGLPVPGGLSELLWHDTQAEVMEALHHPFVQALAAGTLDRSCFQHYVLQDLFFLTRFARAYAAAIDKCGQMPQLSAAKAVLAELLLGVDAELKLHGSYAAKWGVAVDEWVWPSAATSAYTDYLMEVATDPETSVAEVLAAMIPCARLYGFLGCQLAAATRGAPRHAYSEWVETYSGAEYLASPVMKEELFDKIAHTVPYDRLKQLYARAMQLEVNFFSAQPNGPAPRHVGLLVCDFDDTITEKDTVGVLMAAAVEASVKASVAPDTSSAAADALRQQLNAKVKSLADNYMTRQQQLLASLLPAQDGEPAAAGNVTDSVIDKPYDKECLLAFCEALSDFDVEMNQVVVDAGCLAGLSQADVVAAAAGVALRPGCARTLSAAAASGLPVAVLSVNWSSSLVKAVLQPAAAAAAAANGLPQQQQQQQQFEVHANELAWGPDGVSTGDLQREVQCGRDKGRVIDALLKQHQSSSSSSIRGAVVYVGDSSSDILPLLKADYGIVIGRNKLLLRALSAFGVALQPLCSAPMSPDSSSSSSNSSSSGPVLYSASSWQEIAAFLFGPTWHVTTSGGSGSNGVGSHTAADSSSSSSMIRVPTGRGAAVVAAAAAAAAGSLGAAAALGLSPPPVLTIAGSDTGGGAGIQADIKTIMANGGYGMTVLTALTAQNSRGVQGIFVVPPAFLQQQLASVFDDLPPAAVKTGMLPDAAAVETVADTLRQYGAGSSGQTNGQTSGGVVNGACRKSVGAAPGNLRPQALPVVVDPVMVSTSGHALAKQSVCAALKQHLIPLATMITPNLAEAQALLGDGRALESLEDMQQAAADLHKLGCTSVLIKGGHLAERKQKIKQAAAAAAGSSLQETPQQQQDEEVVYAVDVLYDGTRCYYYTAPFIETANTHGTGCTLAAAIATALANGQTPVQAVQTAKDYLTSALAASVGLGLGAGPQHPFNHGAGYGRVQGGPMGLASDKVERPVKHRLNPVDLRMYVVTDAGCNAKSGRTLLQAVEGAVAGGATVVQIREKDIDGGRYIEEARAIIRLCRPRGIPVVINDRVDVAIAAGADGVHVGQSDIPARLVRQMLGPDKILGVSVKTPAEAAKAQADGADYVGVGAVFPTGTKASSVIGLAGVSQVCESASLPAVAIGGVGAHNAQETIAAGAAGLAVVSAVFAAPDVAAATRELRQAVDRALELHSAQQRQQQQHQQAEQAAAVVA